MKKNKMEGAFNIWRKEEVYTEFWWGNLRPLERPRRRWGISIKVDV
jgi:hypothetical protein